MVRGLIRSVRAGFLVGGGGGDLRQHLAFAWRQPVAAGGRPGDRHGVFMQPKARIVGHIVCHVVRSITCRIARLHHFANRARIVAVERLLDHVSRAGLDRGYGRRNVGLARDTNDGRAIVRGADLAQDVEPGFSGETLIEDDASGISRVRDSEKILAALEHDNLIAFQRGTPWQSASRTEKSSSTMTISPARRRGKRHGFWRGALNESGHLESPLSFIWQSS